MKRIYHVLIFILLTGTLFSINGCNESEVISSENETPELPNDENNQSEDESPENNNEDNDQSGIISSQNNLIVYYSWSGNSRNIAENIKAKTNADIAEITLATPYNANTDQQLYSIAREEINLIDQNGIYPAINISVNDYNKYDTIFIVTPLWHARMATPMQSYLYNNAENISDKVIAPVITSASSGISQVLTDLRRLCPSNIITKELWINRNGLSDVDNLISGWLSEINVDIKSEQKPEIETTDNLNIRIIIGNDIITATMYDNATARDFISQLPMSVTLNDYASTEKIFYMPGNYSLSTVGAPSGYDPSEGEITLYAPWGNIAIFYRDYGYGSGLVPMGKIDGDGIKHFQVSGNINATFEKQ